MITIIGAGLSGLMAAYRLKQAGMHIRIIEARDRIGGRIHTVPGKGDTPVEMGATWFNEAHIHLTALLDELKIGRFEQYMTGKAFYQATAASPAQSIEMPAQQPSFRIQGGSSALIQQLAAILEPDELSLEEQVRAIDFTGGHAQITTTKNSFTSDQVIVCLPPKLFVRSITVTPKLPEPLQQLALNTHTWMEGSIKVAVIYAHPFWRERGDSGMLFGNLGPFTECYDQSDQTGSAYALCGFVHPGLEGLSALQRKEKIISQLSQIWGEPAEAYIDYQETLWGAEPLTSLPSSEQLFPHQNNGHPLYSQPIANGNLWLAGSETSPYFGGYMDGAIYAGNRVATILLESQ